MTMTETTWRRQTMSAITVGLFLLVLLLGCGDGVAPSNTEGELLSPPAGAGAMAPHLTVDGDDLILSWLEPGHRFLMARLSGGRWSGPTQIAAGDNFFANWADVPKVAVAGDGTLWAHWLAKIGEDTFAYGVFLARSTDGGGTWQQMGTLHDDMTPTEHGFVAYAAEGTGLRAVWLDGREMLDGGPMTLRTAALADSVGLAEVLDDRVCECCPTALAATAAGPVAFYRDRSPAELRNIRLTRLRDDAWSEPVVLEDDGWTLAGCPVNGPAVAADDDRLVAAWFTAPKGEPRVQLKFSHTAGATFDPPLLVDGELPLGRVDVALDSDGTAWVSWL
ncbi:MAG: hypothetical protein O7A98_10285, partial [Acidobacteria bacterium]|nr:hypothetical protein [Acidobacteriota bacterium]